MKSPGRILFWSWLVGLLVVFSVWASSCGGDDDDDSTSGTDDDAGDDDDAADDDAGDDDAVDDDAADDDVDDDTGGDDDTVDDDTVGDDDLAGEVVDVTIAGFDMNPDPVNITVGDTVRWTNQDMVHHNVTSGDPGDPDAGSEFESPLLNQGDTFEHTFFTAGTYNYFCQPHSGFMNGYQVIVGE